ncbi:MAG: hypothetical protein AAGK22_00420 [Acidobacteriota bacterium]
MDFTDRAALRQLASSRSDKEPLGDFPLDWYEDFLRQVTERGIEVLTFRDLFEDSDDWRYDNHYKREFAQWNKRRDPSKTYLLLQHDVDNHPSFTERMLALEALYGVRSNVFIFRRRYTRRHGAGAPYPVDYEFLQHAERAGFVIGYHQNALHLADFDFDLARRIYLEDVEYLRRHFTIDFMVPHGGLGIEVEGQMKYNRDVPMPAELEGSLRWVFNGYGATFTSRYSDGGMRKNRDRQRLERLDLHGSFLDNLRPGTRNFCLVHPQRWGFRINPGFNPMLEEMPWYRSMLERYGDRLEISREES